MQARKRSARRTCLALASLVFAAAACAPGAFGPTALEVRPGDVSYQLGDEADFAAVGVGGPLPLALGDVRWSLEPVSLGTINDRGHFTAGDRSGTGRITAKLGALSATSQIVVVCPASRSVRGVPFKLSCSRSVDVYVESRIADRDMADALAIIESDMVEVERDLGRVFSSRSLIYVFADEPSYLSGVRSIFGDEVAKTASETGGFFSPAADVIAVDWGEISRTKPVVALRHELTHRLISQLVGSLKQPLRDLPAWLDEGLAHVEESTASGAEWIAVQDRVFVAAMTSFGRLFKLSDLTDFKTWNNRTGAEAYYQYMQSAQAVRVLQADVGQNGINAILERIRDGASFRDAFRAVAGKSLETFSSTWAARSRAGVVAGPNIVAAPRGQQTVLLVYGFGPDKPVTLTFAGAASFVREEKMDEYGNQLVILGTSMPSGAYAITASGGLASPSRKYTITR